MSRLAPLLILLSMLLACAGLRNPETDRETAPGPVEIETQESALDWNDLTRLARTHVQRGEFDQAEERLDQAANQVGFLPAFDARRRTVFGLQARLAIQLAARGETERADALANRLFEIAAAEPEVADKALVDLARSFLARHERGEEPLPVDQKLRILDVALTTAQADTASRERLQLAFDVSQLAHRAGELELARRAIDQAEADRLRIDPANQLMAASLAIYRARIALDQNDLDGAEAAAIFANRIFEDVSADAGRRAIGEITLAQALARKGETENALLVARTAEARVLDAEDEVDPHSRRTVLGGLARVELSSGDAGAARLHFRQALDVPAVDLDSDRILVQALLQELNALDAPPTEAAPPESTEPLESPAPVQSPDAP